MHHNSDVIIHVLGDIAQEQTADDADDTKSNADEVDVLVRLSECELAPFDDHLLRTWNALDAWEFSNLVQESSTGELDGLCDDLCVEDVEFGDHVVADVFLGGVHKLLVKDWEQMLVLSIQAESVGRTYHCSRLRSRHCRQ